WKALLGMAIRPVIVSRCIDEWIGRRRELRDAAHPQFIRTGAGPRMTKVPNVHHKGKMAVKIAEHVLEERLLRRGISEVAKQPKREFGRARLLRSRRSRRAEKGQHAQSKEASAPLPKLVIHGCTL